MAAIPTPSPVERVAYSIAEAAAATSISRRTLYEHVYSGALRTAKIGGRRVIPADELDAFIQRHLDDVA